MKYKVEKREILLVPRDYSIVYTMSNDFFNKKGLAAKLSNRYKSMNLTIKRAYKKQNDPSIKCVGFQPKHEKRYIIHLLVKERYNSKSDYNTLFDALIQLKDDLLAMDVKKIAMPKIGIGSEGLNWSKVEELIKTVFEDTDIEILVCASDSDKDNPIEEEKTDSNVEDKNPEDE